LPAGLRLGPRLALVAGTPMMRFLRPFFNPHRRGVDPAAKWIEYLGRIGYLARAVVYALVGLLAARAAVTTMRGTGTPEAMAVLGSFPLGGILLSVLALGLFCFAVWRFIEAVWDRSEE